MYRLAVVSCKQALHRDFGRLCDRKAGLDKKNGSQLEFQPPYLSYSPQVGKMARDGIEPPTHGFSVRCSTN